MRPNVRTPEGEALGREIARLCDTELAGKADNRCGTCAARAGEHLANGSAETLMSFVKCAMERTPFECHEPGREGQPCAGWLALRSPTAQRREMPWDHVGGCDEP